jgi:mRNA interferase RelE/StbE
MFEQNQIEYLPPAEKYLKKIKDKALKRAFLSAIDHIAADPYVGTSKTGDLAGVYCYDIHYQRTNYELAYSLSYDQDGDILVIILAGTRENFYHDLKRIWKVYKP